MKTEVKVSHVGHVKYDKTILRDIIRNILQQRVYNANRCYII